MLTVAWLTVAWLLTILITACGSAPLQRVPEPAPTRPIVPASPLGPPLRAERVEFSRREAEPRFTLAATTVVQVPVSPMAGPCIDESGAVVLGSQGELLTPREREAAGSFVPRLHPCMLTYTRIAKVDGQWHLQLRDASRLLNDVPLTTPAALRGVEMADVVLREHDDQAALLVWKTAGAPSRRQVAVSHHDLTTGAVRIVHGPVLGFTTENEYVVSRRLDDACHGVVTVGLGGVTCAPDDAVDRALIAGAGGFETTLPLRWLSGTGAWKLEQSMAPGAGSVRSRILDPSGTLHEILLDRPEATCAMSDVGARETSSYLNMMCGGSRFAWDKDSQRPRPIERPETTPISDDGPPFSQNRPLFSGNLIRAWGTYAGTRLAGEVWSFPQEEAFMLYSDDSSRGFSSDVRYGILVDSEVQTLVAIDRDAAQFDVVHRYPRTAEACPGDLTAGWAPLSSSRFVVVHCVARIPRRRQDARHLWSEVFDLRTRRRWRTPLYIGWLANDGTLLATNLQRHDSHTGYSEVSVVRMNEVTRAVSWGSAARR